MNVSADIRQVANLRERQQFSAERMTFLSGCYIIVDEYDNCPVFRDSTRSAEMEGLYCSDSGLDGMEY